MNMPLCNFTLMYDMNVYLNKMYDMNVSFHEVLVHVHVLNMFMFVDLHLLSWKLNFCAECCLSSDL